MPHEHPAPLSAHLDDARLTDLEQRIDAVLRRSGANFNTSYKDGRVTRWGVLSFPDVLTFATQLASERLTASYSAGTGWTFKEDE